MASIEPRRILGTALSKGRDRMASIEPRRILGTALSLLGGIAWVLCMMSFDLGYAVFVVILAVPFLAGACVALLFPFRWAVGIISLAFVFGELLTFFVEVGFHNTWEAYTATATFGVLVPSGVIIGGIAAFLGAAFGYVWCSSHPHLHNQFFVKKKDV